MTRALWICAAIPLFLATYIVATISTMSAAGARARSRLTAGRRPSGLDDAISGVRISGNIFYRCGAGTAARLWRRPDHGGKDNVLQENLLRIARAGAVSFLLASRPLAEPAQNAIGIQPKSLRLPTWPATRKWHASTRSPM